MALKGYFLKIINITVSSTTVTIYSKLVQSWLDLVQPSILRLYNHWFAANSTDKSRLVQPSIRGFCNCRLGPSTPAQTSIRRFDNGLMDGCATFDLILDFKLWYTYYFQREYIYIIFSYFTSYLDVSYCSIRCPGKSFQITGKFCKTIILKSSN